MVVNPHPLYPQQLRPEFGQQLLGGCSRRHEYPIRDRRLPQGRRQCATVHLATGRKRQLVQNHVARRHHMLGQLPAEKGLHIAGAGDRSVLRNDIRHQSLIAGAILPQQHNRLPHLRVEGKRCLDLAKLDPLAPQFHLTVEASQELERPIGAVADLVASLQEPGSGLRAERMGDESLCRQRGAVQVAARQAGPTNIQLSGCAQGHRAPILIQDVNQSVGDGSPDGDRLSGIATLARPPGRVDAGFGRSVQIVQFRHPDAPGAAVLQF